MALSSQFDLAFLFAHHLHRQQTRKGTDLPYLTHLMSVAALVGEYGGSEDQQIAALLHDAVEDQGGRGVLVEIEGRFGPLVAKIVSACSDSFEQPKPPWQARKEQYLRGLSHEPPEVLLVSACDKLHNARSIVKDLLEFGASTWSRFTGGQEGSIWYYSALVETYRKCFDHPVVDELDVTVTRMRALSSGQG